MSFFMKQVADELFCTQRWQMSFFMKQVADELFCTKRWQIAFLHSAFLHSKVADSFFALRGGR